MAHRVGQVVCLLLLSALGGCAGMFGRQGVPSDPLFSNGKPAETKPLAGPPTVTPFSEPGVPANKHIVGPR